MNITPYSYKLKSVDGHGLDSSVLESTVDKEKMCWTGVLACESDQRDRQGDVLIVNGIDFANHKRNPVAFFNHKANDLPIGKTEDENGNYTCWVEGDKCYATIYFSKTNPMAQQIFSLINEKILRAMSIGWKPVRTKPMKGGRGLLIEECELLEASIVGVPANADCVKQLFDSNKINGQEMLPQIKSLLGQYISEENKPLFNGYKAMDSEEEKEMPLGQDCLQKMSKSIKDMVAEHEEKAEVVEHEQVKKCLVKHLGKLKMMAEDIDAAHEKHYMAKEEDNQADGNESVDDDVVEDGEEDGKNVKDIQTKSLQFDIPALVEALAKSAEFQELIKVKNIEVVQPSLEAKEEFTAEELTFIAAAEKKIARYLKMVNS